jgi:hypothetical protein
MVKKYTQYIIEGKEFNIKHIVAAVGCSKQTAYARLKNCKTASCLYKPVGDQGPKGYKSKVNLITPLDKLLFGTW